MEAQVLIQFLAGELPYVQNEPHQNKKKKKKKERKKEKKKKEKKNKKRKRMKLKLIKWNFHSTESAVAYIWPLVREPLHAADGAKLDQKYIHKIK